MFKPQLNKVKSVFHEARRIMKKRIIIQQRNNEPNANENGNIRARKILPRRMTAILSN